VIAQCIPSRTVAIYSRDPNFVTPAIKVLLRKRNKLCQQGRLVDANEMASNINTMILVERSHRLNRLAN